MKKLKLTDINEAIINESGGDYSYGCVMLDVPLSKSNLDKIQNIIKDEDVYEGSEDENGYGRELEPHVTLLYGIHNNVSDDEVKQIIDKWSKVKLDLNKISFFETDKFDVVKFEFNDEVLTKMNKELKTLDFTSNFPDYKAHMTISYVNKGCGKKYETKLKKPFEFESKKVIYSKSNGDKIRYKLD